LSNERARALADGLRAERVERLQLPRARLSDRARAELAERFGDRLVLT
jgi:hypothetical protein